MKYRAGPKSTGDMIRQCLHNSLPKKINDTSPCTLEWHVCVCVRLYVTLKNAIIL